MKHTGYNIGFQNTYTNNIKNRTTKRKNSDSIVFTSKQHSPMKQETIGQFTLGKTLGKGTFGKVKLGTHIITGEKAAIKVLEKVKMLDDVDKERIQREIKILKSVFHPYMIRIYSVIETCHKIYLITEYAEGGDFFNYIILKRRLSEFEACKYFHQLIDAVDYIHKIGICHRDLKPENMLFDYKRNLKLADFGLSNLYDRGGLLQSGCGSPGYASPEMILGQRYSGLMSDIWSCGVVLYVMVCGYLPFDDPDETELYKKILLGKFDLSHKLSYTLRDLIQRILNTDPNSRFGLNEIRAHPWFNMCNIPKVEGLFISVQSIPIDYAIIEKMKQYGYNKDEVKSSLLENRHNNITTLYYLFIKKNLRKGVTSIGDMLSKQFISYIKGNKTPPHPLILTKVDSLIMKQSSQKSIEQRKNNPHTRNVRRLCNDFSFNEKEQIPESVNEINNADTLPILTDYENYYTMTDITNPTNNNNKTTTSHVQKTVPNSRSKHKKQLLENIQETNENSEAPSEKGTIKLIKNLRKIQKKFKPNDHSITKHFRTQYDKYVLTSKNNKKTHFNKGFLQTSMSFHKSQNNTNNKTFTSRSNINKTDHSTTITPPKTIQRKNITPPKTAQRNSISPPKITLKKRGRGSAHSNEFDCNNYKPLNKSLSPYNQTLIKKTINPHSSQEINKRNLNNYLELGIDMKKRKTHCINKLTLPTSAYHPKDTHSNHSPNPTYLRTTPNERTQSSIEHYPQNPIKRYKKNKVDDKVVIQAMFLDKFKHFSKKIAHSMDSTNKSINENNSKVRISPYRKIPYKKSQGFDPKKNKCPTPRIFKMKKSFIKGYNNFQCNTSITKMKASYIRISETNRSNNNSKVTSTTENSMPSNKKHRDSFKKDYIIISEKYPNVFKQIKQQSKGFVFTGKHPTINLNLVKGGSYISLNEHFFHKPNTIHNKFRSKSNCSSIQKEKLPIFKDECDQKWIISKTIPYIRDSILWMLPKKKIAVNPIINTNYKFMCQKAQFKFTIELYQSPIESKKGIYINIVIVEGDKEHFDSVLNTIYNILII